MSKQGIREEDEVKVCELFDQYERRGRAEGRKEGLAEGEKRGLAQGLVKGEKRFADLVQVLIDSGRNDDLRKAVSDPHYRSQLYSEIGLA